MEGYQSEWGELSPIIAEHINFTMGQYRETGSVSKIYRHTDRIFSLCRMFEEGVDGSGLESAE